MPRSTEDRVQGQFHRIVLGGGKCDRELSDAATLLLAYREDEGTRYLNQVPITPPDRLVPEDLAVTILINSRVGSKAYRSIQIKGPSLDLRRLPDVSLEESTPDQRATVAAVISEVVQWDGFAASVASKVLHKKRPALIPILDNQAIFGAYMYPAWPAKLSRQDSVWSPAVIADGLERIWHDLTRPENAAVWPALAALEPARTRIELFDMVWWSHFRSIEPVKPVAAAHAATAERS